MIYIFYFLFLFEIQSFKIDNMFLLISVLNNIFSLFILNIKYSFPPVLQNISWDSHVSQPVFWLLGVFMTVKFPYFCGGNLNFYFYVCGVFHSLFQNSSNLIVVVAQIWLRFFVSSVGATSYLFLCLYKYFSMVMGKDKSST